MAAIMRSASVFCVQAVIAAKQAMTSSRYLLSIRRCRNPHDEMVPHTQHPLAGTRPLPFGESVFRIPALKARLFTEENDRR